MDAPEPGGRRLTFDLLAASIRADTADLRGFMEAFALKMSEALPGRVKVERESGLFSKNPRVRLIRIDLDDRRYELVQGKGGLECHEAHRVRDVILKTQTVPIDDWIDTLSRHLVAHAEQSARVRQVLQDMLR